VNQTEQQIIDELLEAIRTVNAKFDEVRKTGLEVEAYIHDVPMHMIGEIHPTVITTLHCKVTKRLGGI
jgi:hypothetical protein